MDLLIVHEIDLSISDEEIEERLPEWTRDVQRARSRADYVKGIMKFCGIELLDYDTARIERDPKGAFWRVSVRSKFWVVRQPGAQQSAATRRHIGR